MSSDKYEAQRAKFIAKTKRRREFFDGTNPEHRAARKARRELGGMFGKVDDTKFRELAAGTSKGRK